MLAILGDLHLSVYAVSNHTLLLAPVWVVVILTHSASLQEVFPRHFALHLPQWPGQALFSCEECGSLFLLSVCSHQGCFLLRKPEWDPGSGRSNVKVQQAGGNDVGDLVFTQSGRGPVLLVLIVNVNLYSVIHFSFVDPFLSKYDHLIASLVSCSSFIGAPVSDCVGESPW